MEAQRLTGPGAGVVKYDVVTSLAVAGLNGSSGWQTSMMRLITLITARYNWQSDELTVGQREMARMWSVNERTVKREMKRLTGAGLLICRRPGVRGRVGAYRLNLRRIAEMSQPVWTRVGSDFDARMRQRHGVDEVKVVPIASYARDPAPVAPAGQGPWARAMSRLAQSDPGLFQAWFSRLNCIGHEGAILRLSAPSRFIQRYIETHLIRLLVEAVEAELGPIDQIVFE